MRMLPLPRDPEAAAVRRAAGGWRAVALLLVLWIGAALAGWPAAGVLRAQTADAAGVLQLQSALETLSDDRLPPLAGDIARPVDLPIEWRTENGANPDIRWYRLTFDANPGWGLGTGDVQTTDRMLALMLPRACGRLTVLLNGVRLYADPPQYDPTGRHCYQARLMPLPGAMLRERGNRLDIRLLGVPLEGVVARQRAAGLSEVLIGPYPELADRQDTQRLLQVALSQVAGLTLAVLGLLVAALGWLNRRESTFVWFGLLSLGWGFVTLRAASLSGDLLSPRVDWLTASWLAPVTAAGVIFLLRYGQRRWIWVDIALAAQCVLMPASLWWAAPNASFVTALAWYTLFALEVVVAAVVCVHTLHRTDRVAARWIALPLALSVALVVFELATQYGVAPASGAQVAHVALSLLLLAVALRLLQAFADALRNAEIARQTMERRVAEATAEIERNFAQLAELRVEQVTEKERKRIAADLHDDLGAKLLTIVHTSESERISTLAREALEEMRLSVRGLTGKPVQVADALADWRAETVARLGQAGIEADWRGPHEDLTQRLAARTFVQTTRILREAVSNIIKHSGATHCKVRCSIGAEEFVLVIQDNGRGISTEAGNKLDRGQGMYSMKNRAKQMQGQCLVESGAGYGTVIRLTLPLSEHRSTALPA